VDDRRSRRSSCQMPRRAQSPGTARRRRNAGNLVVVITTTGNFAEAMVFGVKMDSVPGSSEPASPIPKRKGHRVRRFALAVAALGVLLLVFILFFPLTLKLDPTFLWLI